MDKNDGSTAKKWKVIMMEVKFELNTQEFIGEITEYWHYWHSKNSRYVAREIQQMPTYTLLTQI